MNQDLDPQGSRAVSLPVLLVLAGAILLLLAVGLILYLRRGVPSPSRVGVLLSEDQRAYLPMLAVSEARLSAAENFLGDTVTYLEARVTNQGTRTVREVELELEFLDTMNQVVLREHVRPINPRTRPLQPGDVRPFQVSFDHLPLAWNQAPPSMRLTWVDF